MEELIDYDEDYELICSSYLQQYGEHFDDAIEKRSFWQINNLVMQLGEETTFGKVLNMRRDELSNFKNSEDLFRETPKGTPQRKKEYIKQVKSVLTSTRLSKKNNIRI